MQPWTRQLLKLSAAAATEPREYGMHRATGATRLANLARPAGARRQHHDHRGNDQGEDDPEGGVGNDHSASPSAGDIRAPPPLAVRPNGEHLATDARRARAGRPL